MEVWVFRAGIFFVAGVITLLIPKKVFRFQQWVLRKLHIRYDIEKEYKYLPYVGISFIIIAGLLLVYSLR